jgi:hypothetical protein
MSARSFIFGVVVGLSIAVTATIVFADGIAILFVPNRQEFACLQKKFLPDNPYWTWKFEKKVGRFIYVKGSYLFGALSIMKVRIVLDEAMFSIPNEKSSPGTSIRFSDVHYLRETAPKCDDAE